MQIIDTQPTDFNKRLLAYCLYELMEFEAATALLLEVTNKSFIDYLIAGRCHINQKLWDDAADCFRESLKIHKTSSGYYWLAIAMSQEAEHPPENVRGDVVGLLEKAIALPDCRPEAYLWFNNLQDWGFDATPDQIRVLRSGLACHPNSREIRLALVSRLLFDREDYDSAASTLQPILVGEKSMAERLWYCFEIEQRRGHLDQAISALNSLQSGHNDSSSGPGLFQIKGELLLQLCNPQKALACFEAELSKQDVEARIMAHMGCALAHFQMNNLPLAFENIRRSIDVWGAEYDIDSFLPGYVNIPIDGKHYEYNFTTYCDVIQILEKINSSHEAVELLEHLRYLVDRFERGRHNSIAHLHKLKETLGLPIVDYDMSLHYANKGDSTKAIDHYLFSATSYYKRTKKAIPNDVLADCARVQPGQQERARIHAAIITCIKTNQDTAFIKEVIAPLYKDFWRDLLFNDQMFHEVLELANFFCDTLADGGCPMFDKAFALNKLGKVEEAEKTYRELIALQPDNAAALHNLSIIVAGRDDIDEAAELSQRAASLLPSNPLMTNQHDSLNTQIAACREEEKRQEDFLSTARERWPELDCYKKKILSTLNIIGECDDLHKLEQFSGTGEKYFKGNWQKLVKSGMVIQNSNGKFCVNKHIVDLVTRERSHSVAVTIIRADNSIAFKPIFNSRLEYTIYNILIGLFPNHLVFPNMSLQTIFQYERMKEILDSDKFQYYLMSQVDFCITSTAHYCPIIAFEVDSPYHDLSDQQQRDEKKNEIFRLGGVPLLRLRAHGQPGEGGIRQEIVEVIKQLGQRLTETNRKVDGLMNLTLEIDFERFCVNGTDAK